MIAKQVTGLISGGSAIFVYAPHKKNNFSIITMTLEALNFNIMHAKVTISRQHCLDTFVILEADNTIIPEGSPRITEACNYLKRNLQHPASMNRVHRRRTPRLLRYFSQHPKIVFSEDKTNDRTIIEIFSTDRPGLLAVIVNTFLTYDIHVQNTKTLTLDERVKDVFFVSTADNKPLNSDITEELHTALNSNIIRHIEKDSYPI